MGINPSPVFSDWGIMEIGQTFVAIAKVFVRQLGINSY
jgi:hypothetical protein